MSRHTANRIMNVADAYSGKSSSVLHLDATALYELAAPSTPEVVRIKDRAIRRAGELLKQIEPAHGKNQNISAATDTKVLTRTDAAEQAGMSKRQAVTAVRVATVPAATFEKLVESEKVTVADIKRLKEEANVPPSFSFGSPQRSTARVTGGVYGVGW